MVNEQDVQFGKRIFNSQNKTNIAILLKLYKTNKLYLKNLRKKNDI